MGKIAFGLGAFDVEPARNAVIRNDEAQSIEPRVMDVLCLLAETPGEVVSRDEMIARVWQTRYGADESITRAISILRRTFREGGETDPYIETVPKRGYRLVQPVVRKDAEVSTPASVFQAQPAAMFASRNGFAGIATGRKAMFAGLLIAFLGAVTLWARIGPHETAGAVAAPERSVAVLPFVAMSSNIEDGYFADGLSEELLNALAGVEDLKVPSRTATFAYKNKTGELKEIGRALGVTHVLEGSVRRSGDQLRITAQLISIDDGYHVWSETYDRNIEDIFVVQDEIARHVLTALKSRLPPDNGTLLVDIGAESGEAYRLYLEGRQLLNRRGLGVARAIAKFEEATALDPNFARAYAGLASAHIVSPNYLRTPADVAHARARTNAMTAMNLDPNLAEPLAVLAAIKGMQNKWGEAIDYLERAERVDPRDTGVLLWHAEALMDLGFAELGLEKIKIAVEIDPSSSVLNFVAGNAYTLFGDYESADKYYQIAEKLGNPNVAVQRGLAKLREGDLDAAARNFARHARDMQFIAKDEIDPLMALLKAVIAGDTAVDGNVERFPALAADHDFRTLVYIYAGDYGRALKEIEIDADNDKVRFWLIWSNLVPGLREDPYFNAFAENTGLLTYWRARGFPSRCQALAGNDFNCDIAAEEKT